MKKLAIILLAVVLVLQAGAVSAFAASATDKKIHSLQEKKTITLIPTDSAFKPGVSPKDAFRIIAEGLRGGNISISSLQYFLDEDLTYGGDLPVRDGHYSFRLVLKATGGLTFDNDLQVYYQGVDGRFQLHYEIDPNDRHTMVVTGTFSNILAASPLPESFRSRVSEDSYFYQLLLKTGEKLSFKNRLSFLLDGEPKEYSLGFGYDLS